MANKDNQSKQYRIYIKESKSWVDVNKEFYTDYYRDINSYRKRQQELGITAMQKLLGKSRFEDLLADYIEKPQGKPTLVPESDKRPAMNTAKNDFMEEYDNE